MKWDCDARRIRREQKAEEKFRRSKEWRRWFAWYPVKVADRDCRWLEFVECRWDPEVTLFGTNFYYESRYEGKWKYRSIK